jgi:YHS domain-containing protein
MPPVSQLVERLSGELSTAKERVKTLQTAASENFSHLQERFTKFEAAGKRLAESLKPRIAAFTEMFGKSGVQQETGRLLGGPSGKETGGGFVTFKFPHSKECPATITLRFDVRHDSTIENLIIEYNLEILPIFISFDKHDELIVPLSAFDDEKIVGWFDGKLVTFARTFLDVHFTSEYQRDNMTQDPVMGVTFPKAFAAGKKEVGGRTIFFYTDESLREFEAHPDKYATR